MCSLFSNAEKLQCRVVCPNSTSRSEVQRGRAWPTLVHKRRKVYWHQSRLQLFATTPAQTLGVPQGACQRPYRQLATIQLALVLQCNVFNRSTHVFSVAVEHRASWSSSQTRNSTWKKTPVMVNCIDEKLLLNCIKIFLLYPALLKVRSAVEYRLPCQIVSYAQQTKLGQTGVQLPSCLVFFGTYHV